ncbi:hypothetical protein HPB50_015967 [Hyalomma asiaticum]|uniref:Uncharacterized protein n=1 Tax=Hyalomma asiaticum TaxID=266040 RepID=A0ACB7TNG2_HYAAI|nr:hypothetical protein HPB50_015967 [Hyalomma asiaticum]
MRGLRDGIKPEEEDGDQDKDGGSLYYNYLLGMPLWSLTRERKDDLLRKRDEKRDELEALRRKTPENLWEEDLVAFLAKLDEVEQAQRDEENSTAVKTIKGSKGGRAKVAAPKKTESETMPSAFAERVVPKIEWEAKAKVAGARRGPKKVANEPTADGQGDDGNDAASTGRTSHDGPKRAAASASIKAPQRKRGGATKGKPSKAKKKKNSWSGSDTSEGEEPFMSLGSDDDSKPVAGPSSAARGRRTKEGAAPKETDAAQIKTDGRGARGKQAVLRDCSPAPSFWLDAKSGGFAFLGPKHASRGAQTTHRNGRAPRTDKLPRGGGRLSGWEGNSAAFFLALFFFPYIYGDPQATHRREKDPAEHGAFRIPPCSPASRSPASLSRNPVFPLASSHRALTLAAALTTAAAVSASPLGGPLLPLWFV